MAVTVGNVLLLAGSVLAAVCALFCPNIEQAYLARFAPHGSSTAGTKGKCPLGYEGAMPVNHPPILGSVKRSESARHSRPQLVTFTNAVIWTSDTQTPWAVNMTVDLATGDIKHMGYGSSSSSSDSSSGGGGGSSSSSSSSGSSGAVRAGDVVDMQGAFVMPGFVDPHVHLIPGGLSLRTVNLRGLAGGRQELADRLAAAAAASGGSSGSSRQHWLLGVGWSESDWGGQLPDRTWIDEACGGRPAFLSRMDSHMALVNTAALQAAGLMHTTTAAAAAAEAEAPTGDGDNEAAAADAAGLIDRDPHTGLPTGLLRESAMSLVERLIPPPSLADRAAALQQAGQYLLAHGVTSVGDMGWGLFGSGSMTWQDLEEVLDAAAAAGDMPVRVSAYVPLRTWKRLASRIAAKGTSHAASSRLAWGGVKEFADGSLGSNTALMWEAYLDSSNDELSKGAGAGADSGKGGDNVRSSSSGGKDSSESGGGLGTGRSSGTRTIPTAELLSLVKGAVSAGLQVAVHAIGDRAVDEVIEVFEKVALSSSSSSSSSGGGGEGRGSSKIQHRIEHVQHISSPAAAAKMAALGLSGVPNPQHLLTDRSMLVYKLGFERSGPGRAFAYRTLADAGVNLGFGSDWPVVEIDPWTSVFAAVHRTEPAMTQTGRECVAATAAAAAAAAAVDATDASDSNGAGISASERVWENVRERLDLSEVLLGHTLRAAQIARLDHWVGRLTPGFKADFVVYNSSPFSNAELSTHKGSPSSLAGISMNGGGDGAEDDTAAACRCAAGLLCGLPVLQQTYMDGGCVYGCGQQTLV